MSRLPRVRALLLPLALAPALAAQQDVPPRVTPQALQSHYLAAIDELRAADVAHLDPARLAVRRSLIRELQDYVARADFGHNPDDGRANLFRDADGRLCAVACLMRATGDEDLVQRIAAEDNPAFVLELAGVPGVAEWLDAAGLRAAEAARIQGPGMALPAPPPAPSGPSGGPNSPRPNSGGSRANPSTGRSPATTASASGPTTGGGRRGGSARAARDAEVLTGGEPVEPWWSWWELNKSAFLPPQRLAVGQAQASRYATPSAPRGDEHERLLASVRPALAALLADDDAAVRAAAALAHARLTGAQAVPELLPLLADPSVTVRESALLALGATGSMAGAHVLLAVARDGLHDGREICAAARPLALVALGVARRRGVPAMVDGFLVEVAGAEGEDDFAGRERREAALLALDLARSPLAVEGADALLAGETTEAALACRALEAQGLAGDPSRVPALLHRAGARELELRRAAAVALGGFDDPLLAAALKTASEVEPEPVARGFLLLALGRQDGAQSRDFLLQVLREGPAEDRPWAALALGQQARRDGSEAARAALREALAGAGEAQGALLLACGIARDEQAVAPLAEVLSGAANPRLRLFAALALGMIGGEPAAEALRARLGAETSPLARTGVAQALGVLGREQDAPALLDELRSLASPPLAAQLATAVGFHGSRAAAEGLAQLLSDPAASTLARAAAADALALLLDRGEPLLLAQVARDRNVLALPGWLLEVLPGTTL